MTPVRMAFDTRMARPKSLVQIDPDSPYCVSLAIRIASSSVSNGIAHTTGPKISSWATRMSLRTSASTAGRRKNPFSPPATSGISPPVTRRAPSFCPVSR